ncbi:glycosyltransferase [Paenibacillus sp. MMS20-IR301]|uniref:glycosyltransferase n=1 Tax=Paenibacillus sp. MMS20-IR301 TaxID=2895946 RepID=UPI0028E8F08B|nr:glycosyltransferase [Paenibacillus sp. MMS20-IR301]WNS42735.1 glycosyltransferase [Paenibacillus sp. MMS20-IR301]
MEKEVDVSVIVPVYNVERYLEKCLNSLVNQTLESLEIIIVNDGSTDASQDIIDKYEARYPGKISAYQKENGGLGEARNYGVRKARGQYIGFVDSDDWVDPEMYKSMYEMTRKGHDIVLCDFLVVQEGSQNGHVAKGFRGQTFQPKEILIYSIDPATACNKLYAKRFFDLIGFSRDWYEDIGTTPIYLSYAASIGYVELPLYYYLQRGTSITYSTDLRTVGVVNSWRRVLEHSNQYYKRELEFAVYKSIVVFLDFKPAFADDFLGFAKEHGEIFAVNPYFQEAVKDGKISDLLTKELIPKKIHYFWFGGNPKSELIQNCIQSWKNYAGDYELIEWNESNCNMEENTYVKEAYEAKKWAFVADYFRIKVLYEQGGFYLDTDTELVRRIDALRMHSAFFAFESKTIVHAGILGAVQGHVLMKKWLQTYDNEHFLNQDGTRNTGFTVVKRLTALLKSDYKIKLNGETQLLKDNVKVYSANVLTIDVYDGQNIAVHHYDASWWDVKEEISYKHIVLKDYFYRGPFDMGNLKDNLRRLYHSGKNIIDNENSFKARCLRLIIVPLHKFYKKFKP